MAKRLTDSEIWDKEWFMELPPELKCLVKYVRDKCNLAGIWTPNWVIANTHINAGRRLGITDLISIDEGQQFVKLDDGKIFCIGFTEFQYGENLNEKSPVHKKVIDILKKSFYKNNTLFHTLSNRVFHTLQEEEKEEEEEEDIKGGAGGMNLGLEENLTEIKNSYSIADTYMKNHGYLKDQWEEILELFCKNCREKQFDGTLKELKIYLSNWHKIFKQEKKNGTTKADQRQANQSERDRQSELARGILNGSSNSQG